MSTTIPGGWPPSPANDPGLRVVQPVSYIVYNDPYDQKYHAVADGSLGLPSSDIVNADAATVINNAIIASGGGLTFIKRAVYSLTTELLISGINDSALILEKGTQLTRIGTNRLLNVTNSQRTLISGGRWNGNNVGFENIMVQNGSHDTRIENVESYNAPNEGILIHHGIGAGTNLRTIVEKCYLHANGFGIQDFHSTTSGPRYTLIIGNNVEDNTTAGIYVNHGEKVRVEANQVRNTVGNTPTVYGIACINGQRDVIVGNTVEKMGGYGIQLYFNDLSIVDGNYAGFSLGGGNDQSGITNDHSNNTVLRGNLLEGNTGDGIHIERSNYVACGGNTTRGNGGAGIQAFHGSNATCIGLSVIGNVSIGNTGPGILFNSCQDSTISGNTCLDNSAEGIILYNDGGQAGCTEIVIVGNRSGDDRSGGSRTQTYGIRTMAQTNTSTIVGNIVDNNLNGSISQIQSAFMRTAQNLGYNPGTGTVTAGASPWTYINADGYDEILVLTTVNGITAVTYRGTAGYPITANAFAFYLKPNDTIVVTWATTAPIFTKYPL